MRDPSSSSCKAVLGRDMRDSVELSMSVGVKCKMTCSVSFISRMRLLRSRLKMEQKFVQDHVFCLFDRSCL